MAETPFQLLKMPILAARQCFEYMDPVKLFELSRLSKRMLSKIKEAAVRCESHSVSFTKDNPSICLFFFDNRKLEIVFNRTLRSRHTSVRLSSIGTLQYSYAHDSPNTIVVVCDRKTIFTLLYHMYDHLAALFPTPSIAELRVDVDTIKNFLKLLHIPEFARCASIQLVGARMDVHDARYVIDTCRVSETFVLTAQLSEPLGRSQIFHFKGLIVHHAAWVTELPGDMDCEHISLTGSQISDRSVNGLIHRWLEGAYPRLATLEVDFVGKPLPSDPNTLDMTMLLDAFSRNQFVQFDQILALKEHFGVPWRRTAQVAALRQRRTRREILFPDTEQTDFWHVIRGLPLQRADFEKHDKWFRRSNKLFSQVLKQPDPLLVDRFDFDIERSDGTMATLRFPAGNRLQMLVWKEPFPDGQPAQQLQ